MSSLHNDLATWAGKARMRKEENIYITIETAEKISEELMRLSNEVERLERKAAWTKLFINSTY